MNRAVIKAYLPTKGAKSGAIECVKYDHDSIPREDKTVFRIDQGGTPLFLVREQAEELKNWLIQEL